MTAIQKAPDQWHRVDGDGNILLYTLRQDGWRKGKPAMVNDVMIRIEAANGSDTSIAPIADRIFSALAALDAETPATPADVGELVERLRSRSESVYDYATQGAEWQKDAICQEAATALERVVRERDEAREALEHDRAKVITACNEFSDAFARRKWLLESRGPYEWDDDRYRDEFSAALAELSEPVERMRVIGKDWSNCPTNHDDIMRARQDWKALATSAEAKLAEALAKLETVKAETRERCAKVADGYDNGFGDGEAATAQSIAEDIRNLEPRHD